MNIEQAIRSFIGEKVVYDKMGQYIWGVDHNGTYQKIADLRGWGAIQNLFKDQKGNIDADRAAAFQDVLGEWIVDAINTKIKNG